jgi:murein DD-endopeptidase MepM/ murein hydrolase activator NlpD
VITEKKTKWQRVSAFLKNKYRLVILNDTTFGEKLSLRLSPLSLIVGVLAITIVMTTLVISFVAFTPLREYIPGYGNVSERKLIVKLSTKADSIEKVISDKDAYMQNILNVLNEKTEGKTERPKKDSTGKYKDVNTNPSKLDITFRSDFEKNKENSVANISNNKLVGLRDFVFFMPVTGLVSESYNITEEHYGVDIVCKADEFIKSTLDGTVIFSGFSMADGYVVHVQHSNNLTSIYKHCADLLKHIGDRVKSGEAIAVVGNTGEKSKGPHLHFEVWYNGLPINPQEIVAF